MELCGKVNTENFREMSLEKPIQKRHFADFHLQGVPLTGPRITSRPWNVLLPLPNKLGARTQVFISPTNSHGPKLGSHPTSPTLLSNGIGDDCSAQNAAAVSALEHCPYPSSTYLYKIFRSVPFRINR